MLGVNNAQWDACVEIGLRYSSWLTLSPPGPLEGDCVVGLEVFLGLACHLELYIIYRHENDYPPLVYRCCFVAQLGEIGRLHFVNITGSLSSESWDWFCASRNEEYFFCIQFHLKIGRVWCYDLADERAGGEMKATLQAGRQYTVTVRSSVPCGKGVQGCMWVPVSRCLWFIQHGAL